VGDLKMKSDSIWKPVSGFEHYSISSKGFVKNKNNNVIKLYKHKDGYLNCALYSLSRSHRKIFYVHRLVAIAFLNKIENYNEVNHIDGNKLNNKTSNLEWMNNSENQKHAYSLGLQPSRAGEGNGRSVLTDEKVTTIKELYNSGKTAKEVSEILEVSLYTVRAIIAGKTWKFNTTDILRRDERRKPTTK
jgi:hypothetical protein